MQPFTKVKGIAAPMLSANMDTDVIMPKQFLKGIDRLGLDKGVFHDLRFRSDGTPDPEFVLNQAPWNQARFLVVGANFGCGSSREHAVWGLAQLGIRALIGSSFAGIFFDNCIRNGVLLVELDETRISSLAAKVGAPDSAEIEIDLPAQVITLGQGETQSFEIDALRKQSLILGLDAIGATLQRIAEIRQFEQKHFSANPWLG